jgi:hypothetical protein
LSFKQFDDFKKCNYLIEAQKNTHNFLEKFLAKHSWHLILVNNASGVECGGTLPGPLFPGMPPPWSTTLLVIGFWFF